MGILDDLGVGGSIPSINISGFISNTWIWVAFVVFIGFIFVITLVVLLFFMTYNKKIILFENISGESYRPVLKTRARIVKLGIGGEELLRTFRGARYLTAYGRKMGKNTYWFAKGQDGYWYNIVLGDLDTKMGMLDIEPIDRDVRMFHVALDRLSHQTYGKQGFLEKYGIHIMLFLFLITLVLGMWFIVGKIGDAVAPLSQSAKISLEIQESNAAITEKLGRIVESLTKSGATGIVPAT